MNCKKLAATPVGAKVDPKPPSPDCGGVAQRSKKASTRKRIVVVHVIGWDEERIVQDTKNRAGEIMRAQGWHAAFANSLRFLVIFFVVGLPQTMRAQVKATKPAATTPSQATQQNLNPGR
ncbi:MAG TPA: hypothetical protein DC054_03645 [Blastocatellia bacterium]|nr:hypothetical protein [Blastocatellia bacterium]